MRTVLSLLLYSVFCLSLWVSLHRTGGWSLFFPWTPGADGQVMLVQKRPKQAPKKLNTERNRVLHAARVGLWAASTKPRSKPRYGRSFSHWRGRKEARRKRSGSCTSGCSRFFPERAATPSGWLSTPLSE